MADQNYNPNANMNKPTVDASVYNQNGTPPVSTGVSTLPVGVSTLPVLNTDPKSVITPLPNVKNTDTSTAQPLSYTGNSIVDALNSGGQASDYASRAKLAAAQGITGYSGTADQNTQLLNKYKAGLLTAQNSGKVAPTTPGDASSQVKDITGQSTADAIAQNNQQAKITSIQDQLKTDPGYMKIQEDYKAYKDTLSQQQSLTEQYAQMEKDANLPGLKLDAMNLKNIIDGTEDDIRTEIQKAGGFATESQVQALSNARNKQNILNYNKLSDQINNVQNHLETMIGLSKEDKANMLEEYKTQIDYDKNIQDYTDKFTKNAADAYNKIISTPGYGYKALYASTGGDPNTIKLVENSLGLAPGSLKSLAEQPTEAWSNPYSLGGNLVQKNNQTGEIRTAVAGKTSSGTTSGNGISQTLADAINAGMIDPNKINSRTLGIYESIAQAQVDAVGAHAGAAGETKAITDLTSYKSTATRVLGVIDKNLPLVANLADKVNQTGVPGLDSFISGVKAYTGNNTDVIKYINSLKTLRSEYAQMLAKGNATTESDKTEAAQAIPAGLSSAGYNALGQQLKLEAGNIIQASDDAIAAARNKSGSNNGAPSTPSSLPPDVQSKISSNLSFSPDGKTAYIPRSVWSTLGSNMDAVLKEAQQEGFTLLVK